ncbi:MAG: hypothetical protein JWP81_883 [Ferruginibacter sp.]|nr:hypothetical protein [Ferruginibacter sp.]
MFPAVLTVGLRSDAYYPLLLAHNLTNQKIEI